MCLLANKNIYKNNGIMIQKKKGTVLKWKQVEHWQ